MAAANSGETTMSETSRFSRRDFLRKSILGVGLGALAGSVIPAGLSRAVAEEPAPAPAPAAAGGPLPKVKRRRLGRTKLEVSEIAGAADGLAEPLLFAAARQAGVNYFHKAERLFHHDWARAILLNNRDQFYLDVVIDSTTEEGAYAEFEQKRQAIGSEYVDFFKVHSTWDRAEEVATKRGAILAYDRLKKEKKVRWLALSKHGGNTPEVLIAAMETGLFDAIQPAVSNCGDKFERVLKVAQDKDVGVICMKTGAAVQGKRAEFAKFGDPEKPFQTYYRYLLSLAGVTSIVCFTKNMNQLRENLGASGELLGLNEVESIRRALAGAPANYRDCIACGACHGACGGLAVADIMRYRLYAEDYGDRATARALYQQVSAASRLVAASGDGIPDRVCPYGLPLAAELQRAHHWLA
jgi:predicted aldo/keto reductase-like oxidoreductase